MRAAQRARAGSALGFALALALGLAGCGHREVTAPCGPLAFAPDPQPQEPFAAFGRHDYGEPQPVNAPLPARP